MCAECGACQGDMGMKGEAGVGDGAGSCFRPAQGRANSDLLTRGPPQTEHNLPPPPQTSLQSGCQLNYINVKKPISSARETEPGEHDAEHKSQWEGQPVWQHYSRIRLIKFCIFAIVNKSQI